MMLETLSACPICQGTSITPFLSVTDYTVSKQEFKLVSCTTCGFVFTNPRPTSTNIHTYYQSENYISHTGGSKSLIDRLYRLARTYTLTWKHQLVNRYSQQKLILDYGCGTGSFLAHMKQKGWNTTGVEPASEARTIAMKQATVHASLETIDQTFSIITLWHVLEHVHALSETLIELKKKLQPSGTIFIAVPNYKSADAFMYQQHWAAYDVPRHLWHFDKTVMVELLRQTGFTLKQIVPMKLDAYYVSMLSEKYKNPNRNSLLKYISAIYNGWLSNKAAKKTGEFSSLIYIAEHA
ncbi:MAG: class I SAM-dependent methyltransferase [Cyclobacteriaceae bacterium]|nr:class I SAM-dependent methyltransferase [Cyclobacteriaceae bacterium]